MQRDEWEALYRNSVPRVYRGLLATLGDPALAEDALHEAFAEGLRNPPARSENLPGWLFRVGLRKARRQRWPFSSLSGLEKAVAGDAITGLLTGTSKSRSRRSSTTVTAPGNARSSTSTRPSMRTSLPLAVDSLMNESILNQSARDPASACPEAPRSGPSGSASALPVGAGQARRSSSSAPAIRSTGARDPSKARMSAPAFAEPPPRLAGS